MTRFATVPFKLAATQRADLAKALTAVAWVRMALWRHRLERVRRQIAANPVQAEAGIEDLRVVAWSVVATARVIPAATCLTQALAGQYLLARRGFYSTVRLSVCGTDTAPQPHAWLLSGDTIALGGTAAEFRRHRALVDYQTSGETCAVVTDARMARS